MLLCSILAAFLTPSFSEGDIRKFNVAVFITQNTIQDNVNVTHFINYGNYFILIAIKLDVDFHTNCIRICNVSNIEIIFEKILYEFSS